MIEVFLGAKGLCQVDLEPVGQVKEIAQHISELSFQGQVASFRVLFIQHSRFTHLFVKFTDLLDEEHKLLCWAIFGPAALLTDLCKVVLKVFEGGSLFQLCHGGIILSAAALRNKRKTTLQNRLSCSILPNLARLGKIFCKQYCTSGLPGSWRGFRNTRHTFSQQIQRIHAIQVIQTIQMTQTASIKARQDCP